MKPLLKKLQLHTKEYYIVHLYILNALIPVKLTPKEIDVLAYFMSLQGDIGKDRFGSSARKMVKEALNLSDGGLGNYLKSLKEKGFITENNQIPEVLIPSHDKQEYVLMLINVDYGKEHTN